MSDSDVTVPEPIARIAEAMSNYPHTWALCGGWAVDAWLGRITREHGDIDVTIFRDDQRALFDYLAEWNLVAHDELEPTAQEPWDGRELELPAHIHARPPGAENRALVLSWVTPPYTQAKDGRDIEFIVNERSGEEWLLSADPLITLTGESSVRESPWGLPTCSPEFIAYYKATAYFGSEPRWPRPHDIADFEALVQLLDGGGRAWLRESIATLHPEHPWLPQLT